MFRKDRIKHVQWTLINSAKAAKYNFLRKDSTQKYLSNPEPVAEGSSQLLGQGFAWSISQNIGIAKNSFENDANIVFL